jgi:hypothetical protein
MSKDKRKRFSLPGIFAAVASYLVAAVKLSFVEIIASTNYLITVAHLK